MTGILAAERRHGKSRAARVVKVAALLAAPGGAQAGSSYLAVWASDREKQDSAGNSDFLAIIDADPRSPTYGRPHAVAFIDTGWGDD